MQNDNSDNGLENNIYWISVFYYKGTSNKMRKENKTKQKMLDVITFSNWLGGNV